MVCTYKIHMARGQGADSSVPNVTQGRVCREDSPARPQRDPGSRETRTESGLARPWCTGQSRVSEGSTGSSSSHSHPAHPSAPWIPGHLTRRTFLLLSPGSGVPTGARLSRFSSGPHSLCSVATWLWASVSLLMPSMPLYPHCNEHIKSWDQSHAWQGYCPSGRGHCLHHTDGDLEPTIPQSHILELRGQDPSPILKTPSGRGGRGRRCPLHAPFLGTEDNATALLRRLGPQIALSTVPGLKR